MALAPDPYEYERVPQRSARERERGANIVPLGQPEEYEDELAYQRHKLLLEQRRG